MARTCVFCGGPANSREHAFPNWLTRLVPGEGPMTNTREGGAIAWESSGFDVKVRQVCRTCNQTWMSELETRAQDVVTALALNRQTAPLSASEQIRLGIWLYKTGIMLALAYAEENHYVPAEHYRFFYEHSKPPEGTSIWIAGVAFDEGAKFQVGWSKPERLDFAKPNGTQLDVHGYRLSFSVIGLLCQVFGDPFGGRFERPRAYRDVWTRVRPISKGAWPPGRWILSSNLEEVAGGPIYSGPEQRR